jgi:hypothetical protein
MAVVIEWSGTGGNGYGGAREVKEVVGKKENICSVSMTWLTRRFVGSVWCYQTTRYGTGPKWSGRTL